MPNTLGLKRLARSRQHTKEAKYDNGINFCNGGTLYILDKAGEKEMTYILLIWVMNFSAADHPRQDMIFMPDLESCESFGEQSGHYFECSRIVMR